MHQRQMRGCYLNATVACDGGGVCMREGTHNNLTRTDRAVSFVSSTNQAFPMGWCISHAGGGGSSGNYHVVRRSKRTLTLCVDGSGVTYYTSTSAYIVHTAEGLINTVHGALFDVGGGRHVALLRLRQMVLWWVSHLG